MESHHTRVATFGPFRLDPSRRLLQLGDAEVVLGTRAFDILLALVENPGENLAHRDLIERAWPGLTVEESNLRVHISSLRKALGDGKDGARYIDNLVGRGYCFVAPVQWSDIGARGGNVEAKAVSEPPSPIKLPQLRSRIVGREAAIEEIKVLLDARRFVSIVGPGGFGKTSVALALAQRAQAAATSKVAFLDLSEIEDPGVILAALGRAVGVPAQTQPTETAVLTHLQNASWLLILDSCEHLADHVATLCETLWDNVAGLSLLVTSREALRMECEQVYHLTPLGLPEDGPYPDLEGLLAAPAIQMFLDKVELGGLRSPINDSDFVAVADICRRLDGVPLAIELVAGQTVAFGFAGTLALLDERHRLRWQGKRNVAPRHQTLASMLDWSYELLTEDDKHVLQCLSAFVGDFTFQAAQAVAEDAEHDVLTVANAITRLVNKSLLTTTTGSSAVHFRLLDTTRAYAAEKLAERGKTSEVNSRHARYFLLQLKGADFGDTIFSGRNHSHHAGELPNIRVALDRTSRSPSDLDLFIQLAVAVVPLFVGSGLLKECAIWCETALNNLGETSWEEAELSLQEGLAISSMFTRGNHDTVHTSIDRGLLLADRMQQSERQLHLLSGNHIFLTRIGDFGGSLECGERCMEVAKANGGSMAVAVASWMIGCAHHLIGNQDKALTFTEHGFDLLAQSAAAQVQYFGFNHHIRALVVLMRTLWLLGRTDEAHEVTLKTIAEAERRKHAVDTCIALLYSSTVSIWQGDVELSMERVNRLLLLARANSLKPYEMVGQALAGMVDILRDEPDLAIAKLEQAIAYLLDEEHHILTPVFLGSLARAHGRLGRVDKANRIIDQALERSQRGAGTCYTPELLVVRGELALLDDPNAGGNAAQWFRSAVEAARRQANKYHELQATTELLRMGHLSHADVADLLSTFPPSSTVALLRDSKQALRKPSLVFRNNS